MTKRIETVVLDCAGLSAWIAQDRNVAAMLKIFSELESDLVISADTIVEVGYADVSMPRLNWVLSRLKVEPVTEQTAKASAKLLKEAKLHGHKYAIDAMVAEVALRQPGPVVMLTSDVDDMSKLCDNRVRMIAV
ncbi:PIN domain-containing protein [Frankia sp. Cppng1_Ct_nod]|uniref:PIN domain-containing protein n=1 Tax=Frankia sp. Cppng1_Ct_nod TaxID=2897162 RepID=UPI0010416EDC|nr:PIN domain-containing protein [Frankia sp. Cppng1_Ct_nod]